MEVDEGQMKSKTLGVDDRNPSTEGGPPGWMAFFVVFLMSFLAMGAAALIMWWTGFFG